MTAPDILTVVVQAIVLGSAFGLAAWVLLILTEFIIDAVTYWLQERKRRRIARIEAELDMKSEQLRRTILSLAEQLAAEQDEASRQMTRAAFLASGKAPPAR